MKNLARAPGAPARRNEPVVPAAIDPEIAMAPDQPTFGRLRTIMDREAALASRYSDETGLFVLPRQDFPELVNAPAQPVSEPIPVRSLEGSEFWSTPAAPVMAARPPEHGIPDDVSAMAPAAGIPGLFTPEPMLPFESIPGVFMGGVVEHFTPPLSTRSPIGQTAAPLPAPAPNGVTQIVTPPAFYESPAQSELSLDDLRLSASDLGKPAEQWDKFAESATRGEPWAINDKPAAGIARFADVSVDVDVKEALSPLPSLVADAAAAAAKPQETEQPLSLPIPPPPLDTPRDEAPAAPIASSAPETPRPPQKQAAIEAIEKADPDEAKPQAKRDGARSEPMTFAPKTPPTLADTVTSRLDRTMYMMDMRKSMDSRDSRPEELPALNSFAEIEDAANKRKEALDAPAEPEKPVSRDSETPSRKIVLKPVAEKEPRTRPSSLDRIDAMVEVPPIKD